MEIHRTFLFSYHTQIIADQPDSLRKNHNSSAAVCRLFLFILHHIRHLCIVDSLNRFAVIVQTVCKICVTPGTVRHSHRTAFNHRNIMCLRRFQTVSQFSFYIRISSAVCQKRFSFVIITYICQFRMSMGTSKRPIMKIRIVAVYLPTASVIKISAFCIKTVQYFRLF